MATTSRKRSAAVADASPHSEQGRAVLRAWLTSGNPAQAVRAANVIAEQRADGFEPELAQAYRGFARDAASDPGCVAKEAIIAALDAVEDLDGELFAEAARHRQLERSKGGTRDTAAGLRGRGVLGLARLGHRDALAIFGTCLGDRDPALRLSAARALRHREHRDGAGLLLVRLGAGEDTPDVALECVHALFACAPDLALDYARRVLREEGHPLGEQLLGILGSAPDDGAVSLLGEELAQRSLGSERRPVIEALGLSRRPAARALLLELLEADRRSDAEAAIAALAIHRYDDRVVDAVRERTEHSRELAQLFREHFVP